MSVHKYRVLTELRYRIWRFLSSDGDSVARGLEAHQYLKLLAIRGMAQGDEVTIRTLTDRGALKHHSPVELIESPGEARLCLPARAR